MRKNATDINIEEKKISTLEDGQAIILGSRAYTFIKHKFLKLEKRQEMAAQQQVQTQSRVWLPQGGGAGIWENSNAEDLKQRASLRLGSE